MKGTSAALLLLWTTAAAAAAPTAGQSVLFDFRPNRWSDVRKPELSAGEKRALAAAVAANETSLGSRLADPVEVMSGHFTVPGPKEKLFVLQAVESGTPGPRSAVAVVRDDKVVAFFPFDGAGVLKATDVNGDGVEEILIWGGRVGLGSSTVWSRLVSLEAGRWSEVHDFGVVESSDCDAGKPATERCRKVSAILSVTGGANGTAPQFQAEYFRRACGYTSPSGFQKLSPSEIRDLLSDSGGNDGTSR